MVQRRVLSHVSKAAGLAGFVLLGGHPPAWAQTSYVAPDGHNRFPAVTIFCPSGTGVAPCNFGGGSGGGASGSLTVGGQAISASNKLPVTDSALEALISGGALSVSGTVGLSGTPTVNLGAGSSVSIANFPATQPVSQTGAWSVGLAAGSNTIGAVNVNSMPALPAGGNAIGSVAVSNFPATQAVSGMVSQAGTWNVGLTSGAMVGLAQGSNPIGSVTVSNFPATQPVSAASLPLPAGAATAAAQTAPLAPVAPGAATATSSTLIGCLANTTLPAFTPGQQGAVACDTSGHLYVVTVPSANNVPTYLQAVTSGGAGVYRAINAAGSTMAASVKASAGMVFGYEACNAGSTAAYVRLFNSAAAPTVGTSTPAISKLVAAGACQSFSSDLGLVFGAGIAVDATGGSLADNDTTAIASAGQVAIEIYYK